MKKKGYLLPIAVLTLGFILWGGVPRVFSDTEINLDDTAPPDSTPAPSAPSSANPTPISQAQSAPTPQAAPLPTAAPIPTTTINVLGETATPTEAADEEPIEVHGVIKMKDIYSAGIKAYQDQDYDKAIRYLKKSIDMQDPYSAKFYYAEANAMLGVIYQFHIIHYNLAYQYYRAALKFEKKNPTALRHIKEVAKYKNEKD